MRHLLLITLLVTTFSIGISSQGFSQFAFLNPLETDTADNILVYYFDLRDRGTYIQLTNVGPATRIHFQVFNAGQNCDENNFFDNFTASDTHVYNMRDIQTNSGAPAGVVLPENAYGAVFVTVTSPTGDSPNSANQLVGNLRILDNSGYEYRTNAQGRAILNNIPAIAGTSGTFGFNNTQGMNFADIVGISFFLEDGISEANLFDTPAVFTTNIIDENENIFSCSDTTFSCASFNYGINNTIPNSRDGELLCSGNNIGNGVVLFDIQEPVPTDFALFVGLNNGNGRGSIVTFFTDNLFVNSGT